MEEGMIDEVKILIEKGIDTDVLKYYGLEYKFLTLHLTGELSYDEMFRQLEIAIHQFAKRQMTWLRKETGCNFIDPITLNTQKVLKNLNFLL